MSILEYFGDDVLLFWVEGCHSQPLSVILEPSRYAHKVQGNLALKGIPVA